MFKALKQKLDLWAIRVGTKTVPEANPRPNQLSEIEAILSDRDFFRPPEAVGTLTPTASGRIARPFAFASSVQTGFQVNNTVHGWTLPSIEGWQKRPLVLLVHGWNAELHYHYVLPGLAKRLARSGFNVAAFELPFHSRRRPTPPEHIRNFISDDVPVMLTATRQALADIEAIIHGAKASVCPAVVVWGFSLGAWLAGLHATVSLSADGIIMTTPVANMERAIHDLEFCFPVRAALKGVQVDLSGLNLMARQPLTRQILLHQANYDMFIPGREYEEIAEAWSIQDRQRENESHISILVSRGSDRRCIDWLRRNFVT